MNGQRSSGRSTDRIHTVLCLTLADYLTAFLPVCLPDCLLYIQTDRHEHIRAYLTDWTGVAGKVLYLYTLRSTTDQICARTHADISMLLIVVE